MGGGEGDGGEIGTLNLDYADWMDYADGFRVIPAKSIVADACGNPDSEFLEIPLIRVFFILNS